MSQSTGNLPQLSPRGSRMSGFLKKLTGRAEEAPDGISIVKTNQRSSFGVPLSTVAKRSPSPPPPAPQIGSPEGAAAAFIVRKEEPSSFPGFNISTMAARSTSASKSPRVTAAEVFGGEESGA